MPSDCEGCADKNDTSASDIEDLPACNLRSRSWFGMENYSRDKFYHRSWMQNQGHPPEMLDGRPIIAIVNTWSGFNPCNGHLRDLAQSVANGVREAGGFPLEVPVFSTGESCLRPTAMLYRNLAAMDVEELKANPVDGFVLLVGCDKTTPACMMGAASTDIPSIVVSGGPMLNGWYKGEKVGSGTTMWKLNADLKAGRITERDLLEAEPAMSRSSGTCNTMGTASSMACMAEVLGLSLSGNAAIPAVDARRKVLAHQSGKRIVELVRSNVKPSDIMTREAFENAIRVNAAIGGSTNVIIHLLAIAGRVGVPLTLDDFDFQSRGIPTIVNLMPAGEYLMEEFYYAGGLPVVLKTLLAANKIHPNTMTVTGRTTAENVSEAKNYNVKVIRPIDNPLTDQPHVAVLRGNIAPNGAVLKLSAASKHLQQHSAKCVVFDNIDDYKLRIDDPELDVDKDSILILRNCGLKGYPGMAEVGNMALPKKLLRQGVTDMVRISDARMSGTAFGTVVLHVSPEAALGGPLAFVQSGDEVELDVENRQLNMKVSEEELQTRQGMWEPPYSPKSGYAHLFYNHVEGPELGADFDFLKGCRGAAIPKDSH